MSQFHNGIFGPGDGLRGYFTAKRRIMNQHFVHLQACIRTLETCPSSLSTSYPTLDFGFHWMRSPCVWEESFPSRSAAVRDAEQAFLPLYRQAEEALRRCWTPSSPDSLHSELCRILNRHLKEAQEALIPMRTQHTAPVLNRISTLLTPDKVTGELEAVVSQHCPSMLDCTPNYLSHVEYTTYDSSEGETGITWLLGKLLIRHGYDLSSAIFALEEDLRQTVMDCRQAFCLQAEQAIRRHILAPLNPLLPILYQLLDTQNP